MPHTVTPTPRLPGGAEAGAQAACLNACPSSQPSRPQPHSTHPLPGSCWPPECPCLSVCPTSLTKNPSEQGVKGRMEAPRGVL